MFKFSKVQPHTIQSFSPLPIAQARLFGGWGVGGLARRHLHTLLPSSGVGQGAVISKSRAPPLAGCLSVVAGIPLVQPGSDASADAVFEVVLG